MTTATAVKPKTTKTKTTKKYPATPDKFVAIADKLIELMEQGRKPWKKCWKASTGGGFCNLISGHIYRGVNPILCLIDLFDKEDQRPYFATFLQAQNMGWKIKKGSKATNLYWGGKGIKEVENEAGDIEEKRYNCTKWIAVFHISCLDDSESATKVEQAIAKLERDFTPLSEQERHSRAEILIKNSRAKISHGGDTACYIPKVDSIMLPIFDSFFSGSNYYCTAIHELGHWTKKEDRCNRPESGLFGSEAYAKEELVAEFTAAFVLNELGIEGEVEGHADYLASWIKVLKNDKKSLFEAIGLAKKAAEYLLGFLPDTDLGEE